ncbi:hypothetical protein D6827_00835 [Candidatus Parcubacteria bacterium]|nr:MAG: hypothetical protein D6827_00835 [Candidatus Parcubacteria bacterium]
MGFKLGDFFKGSLPKEVEKGEDTRGNEEAAEHQVPEADSAVMAPETNNADSESSEATEGAGLGNEIENQESLAVDEGESVAPENEGHDDLESSEDNEEAIMPEGEEKDEARMAEEDLAWLEHALDELGIEEELQAAEQTQEKKQNLEERLKAIDDIKEKRLAKIEKAQNPFDVEEISLDDFNAGYIKILERSGVNKENIKKLKILLDQTNKIKTQLAQKKLESVVNKYIQVIVAPQLAEARLAFEEKRQELAARVEQHYEERKKILSEALRELTGEVEKYKEVAESQEESAENKAKAGDALAKAVDKVTKSAATKEAKVARAEKKTGKERLEGVEAVYKQVDAIVEGTMKVLMEKLDDNFGEELLAGIYGAMENEDQNEKVKEIKKWRAELVDKIKTARKKIKLNEIVPWFGIPIKPPEYFRYIAILESENTQKILKKENADELSDKISDAIVMAHAFNYLIGKRLRSGGGKANKQKGRMFVVHDSIMEAVQQNNARFVKTKKRGVKKGGSNQAGRERMARVKIEVSKKDIAQFREKIKQIKEKIKEEENTVLLEAEKVPVQVSISTHKKKIIGEVPVAVVLKVAEKKDGGKYWKIAKLYVPKGAERAADLLVRPGSAATYASPDSDNNMKEFPWWIKVAAEKQGLISEKKEK